MPVSAFIFDLDGTLLASVAAMAYAFETMIARHGWRGNPVEAYRKFVGNGFRTLAKRALGPEVMAAISDEEFEAVFEEAKEIYRNNLIRETRPYPGITEALTALRDAGMKLAVLSNKHEYETVDLVRHFFPGFFVSVHGQREGVPLKPDAKSLDATLAELAVPREEILYVGDSNVDMYTAANAGLFSVGVAWGFRGGPELAASGAGVIIEAAGELPGLVTAPR